MTKEIASELISSLAATVGGVAKHSIEESSSRCFDLLGRFLFKAVQRKVVLKLWLSVNVHKCCAAVCVISLDICLLRLLCEANG